MRVYDVNLTGTGAADATKTQETQRSGRAGGASSAGSSRGSGDRVELSSTLGRLSQALASDSSHRASRVQALAAQYQSGNYRPDSAATSRGMVADALAAGPA